MHVFAASEKRQSGGLRGDVKPSKVSSVGVRLLLLMVLTIAAGAVDSGYPFAWGARILPPRDLESPVNPVVALATGSSHTMALRADGTVVAWGFNQDGQAVPPPNLTDVIAVAAGASHSLALKADGSVVAWGKNTEGQTAVPASLTQVVAIAAAWQHSVALRADGTVVMWGDTGEKSIPPTLGLITAIATSEDGDYTSALLSDGSVASSYRGNVWSPIVSMGSVTAITQQGVTTVGLRANGTVTVSNANYGSPPVGLTNVAKLVTGSVTMAIKTDGTVTSWGGNNAFGQATVPAGLTNVVSAAADVSYVMALKTDGSLVGWGNNYRNVLD